MRVGQVLEGSGAVLRRGPPHPARRPALCSDRPGAKRLGSIVVHAMPDYENLPFISSRSPYVELLAADPQRGEGLSGATSSSRPTDGAARRSIRPAARHGRCPMTCSSRRGVADAVLGHAARGRTCIRRLPAERSRRHLRARLPGHLRARSPGEPRRAHGPGGRHLSAAAAVQRVVQPVRPPRDDGAGAAPRIRASFYRKLFLAFVAAVFVPVVGAGARDAQLRRRTRCAANIEQEAVRTASAAGRVVEDLAAPRAAQQGLGVDDNLMVWVSRLIDQDVNIFRARLLATSERNLFASGLLPTRTPAEVYRALGLRTRRRTGGARTHRHVRLSGRRTSLFGGTWAS